MAKSSNIGVCPMCAYGGDTGQKELKNSHVIPKNSFKAMRNRMGSKLKGRYIEMPSDADADADARLDLTQEQGVEPMLCWVCEQRLSKEIERPTRTWITNYLADQSVDLDSILLARYAASVWWRAMWSKHRFYRHVVFDPVAIRPLIEASLDPSSTLKNMSFRLRKLTDSSRTQSDLALLQCQVSVAEPLVAEGLVRGHACFTLIHDGLAWEAFSPRLKRSAIGKLKCFSGDRSRYILRSLDLYNTPALRYHFAHNLSKSMQGKVTPAFGKVYPPSRS